MSIEEAIWAKKKKIEAKTTREVIMTAQCILSIILRRDLYLMILFLSLRARTKRVAHFRAQFLVKRADRVCVCVVLLKI